MLTSQWDTTARTAALNSIKFYQKSISPRKGFDCPHRILYGSQSCSSYVKDLLTQQSLLSTVKLSAHRFQAYSLASQVLKSQKTASWLPLHCYPLLYTIMREQRAGSREQWLVASNCKL